MKKSKAKELSLVMATCGLLVIAYVYLIKVLPVAVEPVEMIQPVVEVEETAPSVEFIVEEPTNTP